MTDDQYERLPDVAGPAPDNFPPIMTGPKRQHYLPQFYLHRFANDDLVSVYSRERNTYRREQPKNTGVIGHFYTLKDADGNSRYDIEAMLSGIEGNAAPLFDKLATRQNLSEEERGDMALFVAMASFRTPDLIQSLQHVAQEFFNLATKPLFEDIDQFEEVFDEEDRSGDAAESDARIDSKELLGLIQSGEITARIDEKYIMLQSIKLAAHVAPILANRQWTVQHIANDRRSFITTDSPVLLTTKQRRSDNFYGVGYASLDALTIFPLDQRTLLMMHDEGSGISHREIGEDDIRNVNVTMAGASKEYLIARDEALLKSLVKHLSLDKTNWKSKFQTG